MCGLGRRAGRHLGGQPLCFILGGDAIFAAWPVHRALSFSAFHLAIFLMRTFLMPDRGIAMLFRLVNGI
jgi:cytochrome bd-type quinol oxidase subunit 2